ncbi:MAG: YceI family protein [Pseudomonadota bacterium]
MRLLILIFAWLVPLAASADNWSIVKGETRVEVDVAYRGATVTLNFETVAGNILFDEKRPEIAKASIAVATRNVETGVGLVNAFVKGPDYLAAEAFPQMDFRLDRLVQTSASTADVFGQITMRGITRPAEFKATVFAYGPSEADADRFDAGFNLSGVVDRAQFGSTAGAPQVATMLPVRIRLLMRSET